MSNRSRRHSGRRDLHKDFSRRYWLPEAGGEAGGVAGRVGDAVPFVEAGGVVASGVRDGGGAVAPVVAGGTGAFVLAVLVELLFQPATRTIAISTRTAIPAIQPHVLVALPTGRRVKSLRGSVMTISLLQNFRFEQVKPACRPSGSEKM